MSPRDCAFKGFPCDSAKINSSVCIKTIILLNLGHSGFILYHYNLYFKRVTPITMKSILPSSPLKTKLIIINYNNHDKKPIYK